jgi:protein transport protein SEC24
MQISDRNAAAKIANAFWSNAADAICYGKSVKICRKANCNIPLIQGSIGGKIICLQNTLPNYDQGALKMRDEPKLWGSAKEGTLLSPAVSFYKDFAVDCSPSQISIDLFLFNSKYADVATLSGCVKFTGGSLFYYQGFNATRHEDSVKFGIELSHLLTRPLGLEAVLRIRAPKGIRMTCFHGNFFLRSTDLLSLPNVNPDGSYSVELTVTSELKASTVCFQTALLYTSASGKFHLILGERRIRVITLNLPTTNSLSELYSNADHHAIASLLVKKAVDRSLTSKIEDARDALTHKLTEILTAYKNNFKQESHPQQLMISDNLKLLPAYVLGMLKNLCFKDSNSIPSDIRSYMLAVHYPLCPEVTSVSLYPRFWSIQNIVENPSIGLKDETTGKILFPPLLNLSSEKLDRTGIFFLENGLEIFIFVGREANHDILFSLFGHATIDIIPVGKVRLI